MLKRAIFGMALALAFSGVTAFADAKDDAQAAVKKLADSASYSWTSTVEGGFNRAPTNGKTEKDGYSTYNADFMQDSWQIIVKGNKSVAKGGAGGWMNAADLQKAADDAGGFSPEMIVMIRMQTFELPAAQAKEILDKAQNIKKADDGTYTADLSTQTATDMLTFRRPAAPAGAAGGAGGAGPAGGRGGFGGGAGGGGGNFPQMTVTDAKGTVKIWVKDGAVSKMAVHLTGVRTFNDNDNDVDQTTTTEIKDVGATKITVPDDAKAKLEK